MGQSSSSRETHSSGGLTFAYYCSGHGYGHATRVSAFARHLLALNAGHVVYIVSSAPKHVFSDCILQGALYRHAEIDPVIVQPLAYHVDRQKSMEALCRFLDEKDEKLKQETIWLVSLGADCVLSDAAFLGCLAAREAAIPSVIISNFTFDSVYSYLSTPIPQSEEVPGGLDLDLWPPSSGVERSLVDNPVPTEALSSLVDELFSGYRCADLLLRLPGAIPIPSFSINPGLPSVGWVDLHTHTLTPTVQAHLSETSLGYPLHPSLHTVCEMSREVVSAPLIVRSPNPEVYSSNGRSRFLESIGIPATLHDPRRTKILIVSFGGQVFHKPSSHSRTPSGTSTPHAESLNSNAALDRTGLANSQVQDGCTQVLANALAEIKLKELDTEDEVKLSRPALRTRQTTSGAAALSQLKIAGAPPATVPSTPNPPSLPTFQVTPATPIISDSPQDDYVPCLLPNNDWIAVVCGAALDWGQADGDEIPEQFFVAPRDVYMPDLTAAADVLLGKLGYGTVSECVDACTPFVYVPRPLFIEEHGLRLLLEKEGAGVELSRTAYETGEWAAAVEEAYHRGKAKKEKKRRVGETGKRAQEGKEMAQGLVDWVTDWKAAQGDVSLKE